MIVFVWKHKEEPIDYKALGCVFYFKRLKSLVFPLDKNKGDSKYFDFRLVLQIRRQNLESKLTENFSKKLLGNLLN